MQKKRKSHFELGFLLKFNSPPPDSEYRTFKRHVFERLNVIFKKRSVSSLIKSSRISVRNLIICVLAILISSCMGGKKHGSPPAEGNAILPLAPKLDTPKITSPAQLPYYSNSNTVTIAGTCVVGPGATVYLGGDEDLKMPCADDGTFAFTLGKSSDGIYNYKLYEKSLTLKPSDDTPMSWKRSTLPPEPPTITTPSFLPYVSSGNTITIAGTCEEASTLNLSGTTTESTPCDSNFNFAFTVTKTNDGIFNFQLSQTNKFGNTSSNVDISWKRDTAIPAPPTLISPAISSYHSADDDVIISGTCVIGTSVVMTGSDANEIFCADGTFSFSVNHTTDATYSYSFKSKSVTGILSTTSATFAWQREAALPATPIVNSPSGGSLNSNTSAGTISGWCTDSNIVFLAGDTSASQTCTSSAFSFVITSASLNDHVYSYSVYQKNGLNAQSGAVGITWNRDITIPVNPILITPGISPYFASTGPLLISGVCESGARVELAGDITSTANCSGTNFNFSIPVATEGTYNFTLSQVDTIGNDSKSVFAAATLQWILDSTTPTAPGITQPATQHLFNSANSLSISGSCENNATVNISENVGGNLTSLNNSACTSSTFNFSVNKSTENTFNFEIKQTDRSGNISPSTTIYWTRDITTPDAPTLSAPAQNPFTSSDTNINVSVNCEVNTTVNWSNAASGSAQCTTGLVSTLLSKSSDGTYNLSFTQIDKAGNASPVLNFQWIRISTIPNSPNVTSPSASPYYSNQLSLSISGTCENGNSVSLSGDQTSSTTCAAGSFTFNLLAPTDGTYNFNIIQTTASNISSSTSSFRWIVDRQSPSVISVTSPTLNPYINASNSVSFQGICENLATVTLSGAASASTV
jgi:hypothetical protein